MSFLKKISFSFWNKFSEGKINSKPRCHSNSVDESEIVREEVKRIAELATHTAVTKYGSTIERLAKE